jgi:L-2,4-diaminobutyrate decarboxylase
MATADAFSPDREGLQWALERLTAQRREAGSPHATPGQVPALWPDAGLGGQAALAALEPVALQAVTRLDHPGFLAHMDPPTPWVTWAAALWAASTNQNLLHDETAPSARVLEEAVVGWLAGDFGMDGGHMVPGSTVANLTALWAARDLAGARRVICSTAAHISVPKAAHILGLPLTQIPVDAQQRLRADLLPDDMRDAALVLTAGTTVTGAIDPLDVPRAAWTHIDAAWAGPLRLSSRRELLEGVQAADSVAVSAHKWLYQPKESALVLFADTARAHKALASTAGYLRTPNVGLLGSHSNAALALAATLLAWGRDGVRERIDADLATADLLADLVAQDPTLELWGPGVTGIVAWRPRGQDLERLRQRLQDAWVSLATIDGEQWLRSVALNPHADPQLVVQRVRDAMD